ncbi:trypsin-like peptidase domain-containing protein [Streptomyces sp. H10-C2]|uniref:S1C family serine protease n=1 Tax=unclassified Streptomyces TaxID=2593676 RepID=UPI0024B8C4AD|nr:MULTISPECIES: trypsin-like peptidase domain-containing protein [unclassified Streptomyces]MDJ0345094.1 trypsin-like peptidase domain-containing protein [Streptomyces sp. PH10-H1]MDJ0373999.1 trypsin-like peptidase domain-containing protein [Streptomyces sp. H10-C2]
MTDHTQRNSDYDPNAAYPPPPAYEPEQPVTNPSGAMLPPPPPGSEPSPGPAPIPAPSPVPAPRRKVRKPIALLAAVAITSGVVGGGTVALIGNTTSHSSVSAAPNAVNASSSKTGVAGVASAVSPSIVEIGATSNSGRSTGAGVIITSNGEIITNNHVVSGASSIKVAYSDGRTGTAKVVGTDPKKDLALIKVDNASGLTAAKLGNSDNLAVGDQVVAIGSPEGLTGTVTSGIVSALNRDVTVSTGQGQGQGQGRSGGSDQWPFQFGGNQYNGDTGNSTTTYKAIQTDASLNPGNSGGALINMNGEIIGINSAMYSAASSGSSGSNAGSVGLGFSIPVNTVKADLDSLRNGGSGN